MRVAGTPDFLESIANDPLIRPWVGGNGEVRAGESWARTVALEWDDGGVIFMREAPRVYSVHLVFKRKARDVLAKLADAKRFAFEHMDAHTLVAEIPATHRHVRKCAEAMGMRQDGALWVLQKDLSDGLG